MNSDSMVQNGRSEIEVKISTLQAKIEHSLNEVRRNRKKNRKGASIIKLSATFFSAIATILLGLNISNFEYQFKNIALVLTASVTFLSALEPFFNFRALWVEHEVALWRLYRLKDKLEYYLSGLSYETVSLNEINDFYAEYQNIWDELSQSWIRYRKQEKT